MRRLALTLATTGGLVVLVRAQAPVTVALQPLAPTVRRLDVALGYLGQPPPQADRDALTTALALDDEREAVVRIQRVLDQHVLLDVHINAESRVTVSQGAATPELVEEGTRLLHYHALTVGFRTRISGETDFPCITDDRVGRGRTCALAESAVE
jgi:hypothetical protein